MGGWGDGGDEGASGDPLTGGGEERREIETSGL